MSERHHHPEHSGEALTILKVDPILNTGIVVASPAQEASGRLPDRKSDKIYNI